MVSRILVDVFIWHANLPPRFSFAGHVMVAEHCARAASQALQAGGLPINSTFNQMDDGGQILPKSLHKILSYLAGVNQRNLRGYSGEPHS
jgi:hypothetical protein